MAFYNPQSAPSTSIRLQKTRPTPRNIHHSLKHQRHTDEKHRIIDTELRRAPLGRRSTAGNGICAGIFARSRSRVRSGLERSGGGCGEASVEGIEGVDSSEPGEERSHLSTSIALASPVEKRREMVVLIMDYRSVRRSGAEDSYPIRVVVYEPFVLRLLILLY